ncbi:hypothetical protein L2K20_32190, partial [Mycobacterium sp. MBM]|nr:hypothetical protein [Mycobacterium sp. MBM]
SSSYFFGMMQTTFPRKKVCIKPGVVQTAWMSRRCHNSGETHREHTRTSTDIGGASEQFRAYLALQDRACSNTYGHRTRTSQAEYAGSIPVIGSK